MSDVAFIGDDLNDIQLLSKAGISACPSNAPDYVKKYAKLITKKKGGEGAFREFIEIILKVSDNIDDLYTKYLNHESK